MSGGEIVKVALRAMMVEIQRTDDQQEMERRMAEAVAVATAAQERMAEDLPRKYVQALEELKALVRKEETLKEDVSEQQREEIDAEKQRLAVQVEELENMRRELEDIRGINMENEYIVRREVTGKKTVYRTATPEERKRLAEMAMHRHMLARGVDYMQALERVKRGDAGDADRAVVEYAYYNKAKAARPVNMLWAAKRIDEENDKREEDKDRTQGEETGGDSNK